MKLNEPRRQNLERQIFLAVAETYKAFFIVSFCPTQGLKRKIFDNFRFTADRILNKYLLLLFAVLGRQMFLAVAETYKAVYCIILSTPRL